jgi:hypothetical protein
LLDQQQASSRAACVPKTPQLMLVFRPYPQPHGPPQLASKRVSPLNQRPIALLSQEEPGEEGGTTKKKEAKLPPPDSSPSCFRSRFCLFFFGWNIRTLPPSIVPCHSRSVLSDMCASLSFPARERYQSSFTRASSSATLARSSSTRLRLRT